MKKNIFTLLIIVLCLCMVKCQKNGKTSLNLLPRSRGEIDEMIIVIDSGQWSSSNRLGKTLRETFLTPMLGLPQDESLFKINKASPQKLNSVLKSVNNMVFVTTLDSKTSDSQSLKQFFTKTSLEKIKKDTTIFMNIQKDLFAQGQTVVFLFSDTEKRLTRYIKNNREQIQNIFESSIRKKIKNSLSKGSQKQLMKRIEKKHGYRITIPYGWKQARETENFVWLRKLDAVTEQSLFIYDEPYTHSNIFEDLGAYRDKITHANLYDGENKNVYIARQEIIDVMTKQINFNGYFAVQSKSLWKISDGSRGGPYISYTIVDETKGIIYYIEGYVDSPGTPKKNFIREVDAILSTFQSTLSIKETK